MLGAEQPRLLGAPHEAPVWSSSPRQLDRSLEKCGAARAVVVDPSTVRDAVEVRSGQHDVENLSEEEAADIALYLNFDMVASPNYMFGIYDGDNSGGTAPPGFIPEGSAQIEDVFERYYADRGEPSQDSEFSGRSDYGPFIAIGVPAGGLFTGAEDPKTPAEAALYGGVAGAAYDPCYHQFCDNLRGDGQPMALYDALREDYELVGNINVDALDGNSDAIATAVLTFGYDTSTVNGVPGKPGKSKGRTRATRSTRCGTTSLADGSGSPAPSGVGEPISCGSRKRCTGWDAPRVTTDPGSQRGVGT